MLFKQKCYESKVLGKSAEAGGKWGLTVKVRLRGGKNGVFEKNGEASSVKTSRCLDI